jgi:hypothetical protein
VGFLWAFWPSSAVGFLWALWPSSDRCPLRRHLPLPRCPPPFITRYVAGHVALCLVSAPAPQAEVRHLALSHGLFPHFHLIPAHPRGALSLTCARGEVRRVCRGVEPFTKQRTRRDSRRAGNAKWIRPTAHDPRLPADKAPVKPAENSIGQGGEPSVPKERNASGQRRTCRRSTDKS